MWRLSNHNEDDANQHISVIILSPSVQNVFSLVSPHVWQLSQPFNNI